MNDLAELQTRLDKARAGSKLSGEYWRIVDRDGTTRFLFLDPAGDLKYIRKLYPGCDGATMTKDEWIRTATGPIHAAFR